MKLPVNLQTITNLRCKTFDIFLHCGILSYLVNVILYTESRHAMQIIQWKVTFYSKGVHVWSRLRLALNETVRCNFLVYCKLSNTRIQLNRWIRCHSEDRYRTFDNKMVFGRVGGFIERYHLYRPKYDERQENHTKMVSGSVFCGKWG